MASPRSDREARVAIGQEEAGAGEVPVPVRGRQVTLWRSPSLHVAKGVQSLQASVSGDREPP